MRMRWWGLALIGVVGCGVPGNATLPGTDMMPSADACADAPNSFAAMGQPCTVENKQCALGDPTNYAICTQGK